MKRKTVIILTSIAFLILTASCLPYLFRHQIRNRIEEEINNNIEAIVSFDHVGYSILKNFPNFTLTLHDVIVQGKGRFSGDTLTSIKEFSVALNLSSLINGKTIEIKSILLDEPKIDVVVLADGLANYSIFKNDSTANSTDTSSSLNLTLDKVKITNGFITYDDRSSKTLVNMSNVNYTGQGDFEKDIFDLTTELNIEQLTVDYGKIRYLNEKQLTIHLILEINNNENKYYFKENVAQINDFKFGLQGFIALLPNAYNLDLKFATQETKFKNILSLVPGIYMEDLKKIKVSGDLGFSGFVKGIYHTNDSIQTLPFFKMNLNIENGKFKIDTLPEAIENVQLEIVLENQTGVPDSTHLDINKFHLDMGKNPIHGQAHLVGINDPMVNLELLADINLAELEKMYPIKGIDIKGKLDFDLKANGKYQSESNTLQHLPAFHLNMALTNGRVKYDSLPSAIENIQLKILAENNDGNLENSMVDFQSIHFTMGKRNLVHGSAKIEGYSKQAVDADIKANLDLADIEKMYPVDGLVLKGLFALDVKVNGIYEKLKNKLPVIDATMNLTNGYMKTDGYPEPLEKIHLIAEAKNSTGKFSDTKLNIERFTYTLEDEPFEVSGSIKNLDTYAYDITVKGLVDLNKITKIYPIEGYAISGIIDSDFETRGTVTDLEAGKYDQIVSNGNVAFKQVKIIADGYPQSMNISDAFFTFTPSKIMMERFDGQFGKSHVTATGDLINYMSFLNTTNKNSMVKADIKLNCDKLDLNEWLADNTTSNSSSKAVYTPDTTNSHPQISVWEVPKNLDLTFDSNIDIVRYEDMFMTKVDGEIRILDGVLSLTETGFNTLDAFFRVSGDYNTRDLNHPLFDFKLNIKELDINKAYRELKLVRDLAPAAADAYGIFSVDYSLKGELDQNMSPKTQTLTGGGQIHIADAKIDGMKLFDEISKAAKKEELNNPTLKDVVINTEIRDNKLYVKPFTMKVSGFDLDIEGVNNIDGAISYLIKIELFPIEKLKIPCHVTGTYDKPKVMLGKGNTKNIQ